MSYVTVTTSIVQILSRCTNDHVHFFTNVDYNTLLYDELYHMDKTNCLTSDKTIIM